MIYKEVYSSSDSKYSFHSDLVIEMIVMIVMIVMVIIIVMIVLW
jgi:hypothetical protein